MGYNAYLNGYKNTHPFFEVTIRYPYTGVTEAVVFNGLTASQIYSGAGGRLMDIN